MVPCTDETPAVLADFFHFNCLGAAVQGTQHLGFLGSQRIHVLMGMLRCTGRTNHGGRCGHQLPNGCIIVPILRHNPSRYAHLIHRGRFIGHRQRNFHCIGRIVGGVQPQHIVPCLRCFAVQLAIPVIGGGFYADLPPLGCQQGLHIVFFVEFHHKLPFSNKGILHIPVAIPVIGISAGQGKKQCLIAPFQVEGDGGCLGLSVTAQPLHEKAVAAFLHLLLMIPQAIPC